MHNYEKKIQKMLAEGKLPTPERGKVYDSKVSHDSWCRIYNGGECNCDPDITITEITAANRDRVARVISDDMQEFKKLIDKKKV